MNSTEVGKRGEQLIAEYLMKSGFAVIKRNYHSRYGEIDIISANTEYIVFTEVKTRREGSAVTPAESVDIHKQKRIILTAEDFLSKTETELQPRFDVAEVTVYRRRDGSDGFKLHYIKNAF